MTPARAVGSAGEPYPAWVRDLEGRSGVYVIREAGAAVYVGSSVRSLRRTLCRHFSTWRRRKSFWSGLFGSDHDPGLTYDRSRCTVAIELTTPSAARTREAALIRRLKPRDNVSGADVVPF